MAAASTRDRGFTLVELMVALLILGVVLAAVGPALYGAFAATSMNNQRSEAIGLAVAANEQIRSLPYYDVGYGTTSDIPASCSPAYPTGTGVTLAAPGPMDSTTNFPLSQPVGNTKFQIVRCVNWANASDPNTDGTDYGAYKQSIVSVTWTDKAGSHTVTQQSDVYPGGEPKYTSGYNNYPPAQATFSSSGQVPPAPTSTSATTVSGSGGAHAITVSWPVPAGSPTPDGYIVEYNTTGDFSGSSSDYSTNDLYASSPLVTSVKGGTGSWTATGLTPGTAYVFRVISMYQGTPSATASPPASQSTSGSTSSTCHVYGLVITPTQAQINAYGYLQGISYFTMSVNADPSCTNGSSATTSVWLYYTTSSSSTLVSTQMLPQTGAGPSNGAMLTGVTLNPDGSQMTWIPGNHTFTVYTATGGTPSAYSPSTYVQVNICQPNPATGLC